MSQNAEEQIQRLLYSFPSMKRSGNDFLFSAVFSNTSFPMKLSIPLSFPSGGVSLSFTKPVRGKMVAVNGTSVMDNRLQNFNGMTWISDTLSEVLQSLNQSGVQFLSPASTFQTGGFNTQPYAAPSPGVFQMQQSPVGFQMQPSPGGIQMRQSPGSIQVQPVGFQATSSGMLRLDITPREWWEQELSNIGLDKRTETDLSNLIANASARDELFDHNAHVSVMKLEMANIQKKGEEYEKCVQSYEASLEKFNSLRREVDGKKAELAQVQNGLTSKLQMFTKPELLGKIQDQIVSLQKLSDHLKTQYLNQEISASEFSKQFMTVESELVMLRSCMEKCDKLCVC